MINKKLNIICLSNQQWDFPFPTNKKHVMSRLSKLGHNVLFVDPPINTGRLFVRQILRKQWGFKRLFTQQYRNENTLIYSPLNAFPNGEVTSKMHADRIAALAQKHFDPNLKTVLWIYHVEIVGLQNYLDFVPHDLLVYDCVDNYTAFPENSLFYSATASKNVVEKQEKILTETADVVFATAPGLVEKLKKYRPVVHYTPNVGDFKKISKVDKYKDDLPQDLQQIPRPRIGFVGAIDDYKLDVDLVKKIASDHKDYSFVIVGPMALKDREGSVEELGLEGLPNIYFLGSKPYEIVDRYFAGFDVFTIPFQLNDYTVGGCFPVKFHDSLAAGLPTVVTNLPAYTPFAHVCYISKDYDQFSSNIQLAIKQNSSELVELRKGVAKQNNWDGKVEKMLEYICNNQKISQ